MHFVVFRLEIVTLTDDRRRPDDPSRWRDHEIEGLAPAETTVTKIEYDSLVDEREGKRDMTQASRNLDRDSSDDKQRRGYEQQVLNESRVARRPDSNVFFLVMVSMNVRPPPC